MAPPSPTQAAGFSELSISNFDMNAWQSNVEIIPGLLADEAAELFTQWLASPQHRAY